MTVLLSSSPSTSFQGVLLRTSAGTLSSSVSGITTTTVCLASSASYPSALGHAFPLSIASASVTLAIPLSFSSGTITLDGFLVQVGPLQGGAASWYVLSAVSVAVSPAPPVASPPLPPPAAASAATAPPPPSGSSGSCASSSLGYACSFAVSSALTLHWTLAAATGSPLTDTLALAAEAPGAQGWVGIAFAGTPGQMAPADAVIGWVSGGRPGVTPYRLTSNTPEGVSADASQSLLAASASLAAPSGLLVVAFRRALSNGGAQVISSTGDVYLNWALGPSFSSVGDHGYYGRNRGALRINFATGAAANVPVHNANNAARLAHGSLMVVAFAFFLPLGVSFAFAGRYLGGVPLPWKHVHSGINAAGVLIATAAFIIPHLITFTSPGSGDVTSHGKLGHAVMALAWFQPFVAALFLLPVALAARHPAVAARLAGAARWVHLQLVHRLIGWATLALGLAQLSLGVFEIVSLTQLPGDAAAGLALWPWVLAIGGSFCLVMALVPGLLYMWARHGSRAAAGGAGAAGGPGGPLKPAHVEGNGGRGADAEEPASAADQEANAAAGAAAVRVQVQLAAAGPGARRGGGHRAGDSESDHGQYIAASRGAAMHAALG